MTKFKFFVFLLLLVLGGCISVSTSPTPRFYMLQAIDKKVVAEKFDIGPNTLIGIGPVKIPEYLNRPQMVTVKKNNTLDFAQFDRWGEPLDLGFARTLEGDISSLLPNSSTVIYPWGQYITPRYQLVADIIVLECRLKADLLLVIKWSVIDLEKKAQLLSRRSELRLEVEPHTYSGFARALSDACYAVSQEISRAISEASAQKEAQPAP